MRLRPDESVERPSLKVLFDTLTLAELPPKILLELQAKRVPEAAALTRRIMQSPPAVERWLPWLDRVFGEHTQLNVLVEVLWESRHLIISDMFVFGFFLRLCNKTSKYEKYRGMLRTCRNDGSPAATRFSESAHLHYFCDLTDEQKSDFVSRKYEGWKVPSHSGFFHAVDEFSNRADVGPRISAFLYANRSDKNVSYLKWLEKVRAAELVKHIQADAWSVAKLLKEGKLDRALIPRFPDIGQLVDRERTMAFFQSLDTSRGLLLTTFHGAYVPFATICFLRFMPDQYVLGINAGANQINAVADRRGAAYRAVKALQGGKTLLMAPDGRALGQTSNITVFGLPLEVADGAPAIAYESGCKTGWYTVIRVGDRLVPEYDEGPTRIAGENFEMFKNRWWKYYASRIERCFAGDAINISLRAFWPDLISSFCVS